MPTLMFWNICKNDVSDLIAGACIEHDVDILVLAESEIAESTLLAKLNQGSSIRTFAAIAPSLNKYVKIFTSLPLNCVRPLIDDGRLSITHVTPPIGEEFLLAAMHLPSKAFLDASTQYQSVRRVRQIIENTEDKLGIDKTVLIGDLNANPFEESISASDGFHAIMDASIALKLSRNVQGESRSYFYNPMWNCFGDAEGKPPGTYYYNNSGANTNYFWNIFDQIMFRPGLIRYFKHQNLKLVTSIGNSNLMTNGTINQLFSDHLPLVCTLNTEYGNGK